MRLVKDDINETEGKLTVWRTDGPLDDMIFELSANLTADGERLIVVDATGFFDPLRVSRTAASVARSLHVLRTTPGAEEQTDDHCPAARLRSTCRAPPL